MKKGSASFDAGRVSTLEAKEKTSFLDELLYQAFDQCEELFGRYGFININNVGRIPKEFYSLKNPRIVVVPPLIGNREVVEILSKKKGFKWKQESVSELWRWNEETPENIGIGFSGKANLYAVESGASPTPDTLGVKLEELSLEGKIFWSDFVPYILSFYQNSKDPFDKKTGTCFPHLSKRCNALIFCKYDEQVDFLSIWRGGFEDHPKDVGVRRIIKIPFVDGF